MKELIKTLRLGASISRERNLNLDYALVADKAADVIERLVQANGDLATAVIIQEGYQLIPIEPTPQIALAFMEHCPTTTVKEFLTGYKAMLEVLKEPT